MWSEVIQQVSLSEVWLILILDGVIKMTILLMAGWGVAIWMKRHSASARHVVWGMTLGSTLLIPVGMWVLPGWGTEWAISSTAGSDPSSPEVQISDVSAEGKVRNARRSELSHHTSRRDSESRDAAIPSPVGNGFSESTTESNSSRRNGNKTVRESRVPSMEAGRMSRGQVTPETSPDLTEANGSGLPLSGNRQKTIRIPWWLIVCVWGCGFVAVILPFGVGLFRVTVLCRRSNCVREPSWVRLLTELAHTLQLRRSVRLMRLQSPLGPLAGGVLKPFVLLPDDCDDWSLERRRLVLLHELAHIKRCDVLTQWVVQIICAIYWFHPLVWFAAWQMRIERERACDDLVLATGMKPADYAEELVGIAATYRSPRWVTVAALAMARTSPLEDRLHCLLDANRPRFRLSHRAFSLVLAGGLSLATVIASAGKVVVRDAAGAKVGEITIPKGGTVTLEETVELANASPKTTPRAAENGIKIDQRLALNEWPMWGGTNHRNNVSRAKQMPLKWNTEQGENIRWSSQLGSVIFGGTVVAGDRIFVGTNNNAALVNRFPKSVDLGCLVCLDRQTGKFLWQHSNRKLPTGRIHDWPLQGVMSTPCISGDRLWYVTNRCEVVCLDVAGFRDGKNDGPFVDENVIADVEADVVWKLDMRQELGVSPHNVSTCSPTTDGKRLFVITGNGTDASHVNPPPKAPDVICLDCETGKVLWQDRPAGQRTLHGSWSSPTYGILKGQPMVLMGCGDGWVYAYDPAGDGRGHAKLLWKFDCNPKDSTWRIGGRGDRNPYVAIPVIWEDKVYLRTGQDPEHGEGKADLWCIDPVKHLDGSDVSATQVYAGAAGKPIGSPLPPRRKLNLDKTAGEVELPNPKSAVLWHFQKQDLDGNGQIEFAERIHRGLGSPAIKDGLLFITDVSGLLFCLDASTGRCHWTYDLFAACYGSPLIADGKVYVGDEDGDIAIFKVSEKRTLLSEITNESSTYCTPVACGETLYVLDKSHLHAIALPPQGQHNPALNPPKPIKEKRTSRP